LQEFPANQGSQDVNRLAVQRFSDPTESSLLQPRSGRSLHHVGARFGLELRVITTESLAEVVSERLSDPDHIGMIEMKTPALRARDRRGATG
jgi:hypothetical protein